MDLQKPKKSRADTHGDQEEASEYCVDGFGRSTDSKNTPENESLDPRQDAPGNGVAAEMNGVHIATTSLPRETTSPSHRSLSHSRKVQRRKSRSPAMTMLIPKALNLEPRQLKLLQSAEPVPPVTKETLSELDLERIMRNIHLRTDANFERDLHFKPDLDGEKGLKKRRAANDYWDALQIEISICAFCTQNNIEICHESNSDPADQASFTPRLPTMFETLQDILKTLVPERDHPSVMQNLDVPLLMQQVRKGVLDLVGLSTWLAGLLKMHCAPMRDKEADKMVEEISTGYRNQDMAKVVNGLRTLFGVLEMMKLDVANHQIRAFRILLIEDTIPFLQGYFYKRIMNNEFRVEDSKNWYLNLQKQSPDLTKESKNKAFAPVAVMFRGLAELLLQFHDPVKFPQTFHFDIGRLWQLRAELQNVINIDICWSVLEDFVGSKRWTASSRGELYSTFRSRISPLLEDNDGRRRRGARVANVANIALEVARLACVARGGKDAISDSVLFAIEKDLEYDFTHESRRFSAIQDIVRKDLLDITFELAKKYLTMSPLAICESQRTRLFHPQGPVSQHYIDLEAVAMRLAHIGVLHWRVWGPLLYVRDETSVF
ncbi:hypothetical protein VTN77DRAFT_1205 [Rasamsonia byssochlamydoides]|uniref:uncharacterized protein n=1 Tax=Rasamsonia byssochlamydoides TaxID=89139 RepID=UPI003743F82E